SMKHYKTYCEAHVNELESFFFDVQRGVKQSGSSAAIVQGEVRKFAGVLHSLTKPAVMFHGDCQRWYRNGRYHRKDGPAVINNGGRNMDWWEYGKMHRCDGPAVINNGGR